MFIALLSFQVKSENSKLFREYIGAEDKGVIFSDVPIKSSVEVHFILSFATDYSDTSFPASPTNGDFHVYWDMENLSPSQVSFIKTQHSNIMVAMSLGGDTINDQYVHFSPKSITSWVRNAIKSITEIVSKYDLDRIDIDYEHFHADTDTFSECIGQLLVQQKQNQVVKFASIAPYDDSSVQPYYLALRKTYGHLIDYGNFQFYAYDRGTTVSQFLKYFEKQSTRYKGGEVLGSFSTDGNEG